MADAKAPSHAASRSFTDQEGNFHLNGASFYNDNGDDIADSLEQLNSLAPAEIAFIDGVTAGTAAASKALVLSAGGDIATITSATITTLTSTTGNVGSVNANDITGTDSSLGVAGQAAAQGGAIAITGGTSSTAGNAGGAVSLLGGTPGSTSAGGAVNITGAVGGSASGAGGAVVIAGGAGTAGNSIGGVATVTGGAGQGTANGAAVTVTGGAGGTGGATGNGGAAGLIGGASLATNGTGGAVTITGGLGTGTAAGGAVNITSGAAGATGVAGAIAIAVGAATAGNGSSITITGGNGAGGTNSGGDVNVVPGAAVSTGTPGEIKVNSVAGIFEACWQQYLPASVPVSGSSYTFFMANRACRVRAVSLSCSSTATVPTLDVMKDTGTTAPGGGSSVLASASAFNTTANTRVIPSINTTVATITLAAGDRLSAKFGGTVGSITGAIVSVLLSPC